LRKATTSFVMSVCPSVRTSPCNPSFLWTDLHDIWNLNIFRKSFEKIQLSLKSDKSNGYFYMKTNIIFFIISRSFLFRMRNVSDKNCRKTQNTHLTYTNFFPKIVPFMEEYCTDGHRYGACALPAGYLMLQTHTQKMQYLLLFHCNNGCSSTPQGYVICTLSILF